MKWCSWILNALLLAVHTGCGTVRDAAVTSATSEAQPLAYVGQVQFGEPKKEDGCVIVPLTYEGGQWASNSAIVAVDVRSTIDERDIDLTVITAVSDGKSSNGVGNRLALPEDSSGDYMVYYRDPDGTRHEIGELTITQ